MKSVRIAERRPLTIPHDLLERNLMFPTRLVDPRRLDYHRRMADVELAPIRIAGDLTMIDAGRAVARDLGYELCSERTACGLHLVWAIAIDATVSDACHAWPKAAITQADAVTAQVCLLLDEDCQIFFEPHEVRRYLPASMGAGRFGRPAWVANDDAATMVDTTPAAPLSETQTLTDIVSVVTQGIGVMIEGVDSCVRRVTEFAEQHRVDIREFKDATRRFVKAARQYLDEVLRPASGMLEGVRGGEVDANELVSGLQSRGQIVFRSVTLCLRNVFVECQRLLASKEQAMKQIAVTKGRKVFKGA